MIFPISSQNTGAGKSVTNSIAGLNREYINSEKIMNTSHWKTPGSIYDLKNLSCWTIDFVRAITDPNPIIPVE